MPKTPAAATALGPHALRQRKPLIYKENHELSTIFLGFYYYDYLKIELLGTTTARKFWAASRRHMNNPSHAFSRNPRRKNEHMHCKPLEIHPAKKLFTINLVARNFCHT
ncbi:hypothetical protein [Comamonas antarctica]|uniref:hypothetical protein n=1 Tax=Comamonas antarctica TaxID=2743470 RepID=UPI0028EAABB8|nr:hypothetical protein [Comamonas antarctica]